MGIDAPALRGIDRSSKADDDPDRAADDLAPSTGAALPAESVPLLERLLLRRLQRGDARAFQELVRRHQDRVFSICLRMLGDASEAEDICQDVFLAVHRHLPRFRGDSRLSTWIFRVTRNHCLNRLKYLERRGSDGDAALDRLDAGALSSALVTAPEGPERALLAAEQRRLVHEALLRLSAEHRLLVVLRDIEGLAYEDIARVTALPVGTVKSRLHRARAALAGQLEADGMAPDGVREGSR